MIEADLVKNIFEKKFNFSATQFAESYLFILTTLIFMVSHSLLFLPTI